MDFSYKLDMDVTMVEIFQKTEQSPNVSKEELQYINSDSEQEEGTEIAGWKDILFIKKHGPLQWQNLWPTRSGGFTCSGRQISERKVRVNLKDIGLPFLPFTCFMGLVFPWMAVFQIDEMALA